MNASFAGLNQSVGRWTSLVLVSLVGLFLLQKFRACIACDTSKDHSSQASQGYGLLVALRAGRCIWTS